MAYSPTTDFLAMLRLTSGGVRTERVPGLDYVVAAMARAGMFQLSVGQTPPTVNQPNTLWLQPSVPSWAAEGIVFLWNASLNQYQVATPALWLALLTANNSYAFQSVTTSTDIVLTPTTVLAVQRAAPIATALSLPPLNQRVADKPLKIVDWSTGVAGHTITITTPDGSTIMKQASLQLLSTAVQLASVALYPIPDLNGWIIAP